MICRKLYAHKGSILLNSPGDHGKPRRFFFFGSSLERILYVIPVGLGIVLGRNRMARKRHKKNGVLPRGPNFERPLLRVICFFCGVLKKVTVYRAADQQPQYQAERARCAGYGLVTKFTSKITNSPESKIKLHVVENRLV